MKYIENERMLERVYVELGKNTSPYWKTSDVMVIKMKDGSYTLGIDICYKDKGRNITKTCEIKLDENNKPYIDVGDNYDFTPDNCAYPMDFKKDDFYKIDTFVVSGTPLYNYNEYLHSENSVVRFEGKCLSEEVKKYFSGYYHAAGFSELGLAIMLKFIQDPKNRQALDERMKGLTDEEKENLQAEILRDLQTFFSTDGKKCSNVSWKIDFYRQLVKGIALKPETIITLDIADYENLLKSNPNKQKQ